MVASKANTKAPQSNQMLHENKPRLPPKKIINAALCWSIWRPSREQNLRAELAQTHCGVQQGLIPAWQQAALKSECQWRAEEVEEEAEEEEGGVKEEARQ